MAKKCFTMLMVISLIIKLFSIPLAAVETNTGYHRIVGSRMGRGSSQVCSSIDHAFSEMNVRYIESLGLEVEEGVYFRKWVT